MQLDPPAYWSEGETGSRLQLGHSASRLSFVPLFMGQLEVLMQMTLGRENKEKQS